MIKAAELPDDIVALEAMQGRADRPIGNDGRRVRGDGPQASVAKSDRDQFELPLEDLETAIAGVHAEEDAEDRLARQAACRTAPIVARSPSMCRGSRRSSPKVRAVGAALPAPYYLRAARRSGWQRLKVGLSAQWISLSI